MPAQSIVKTRWDQVPIACPSCGSHGEKNGRWTTNAAVPFKLVEEVLRSFEFSADVDGEGKLSMVADVQTDSVDWESGANLRIECMGCFNQFSIPAGADVDFDDL